MLIYSLMFWYISFKWAQLFKCTFLQILPPFGRQDIKQVCFPWLLPWSHSQWADWLMCVKCKCWSVWFNLDLGSTCERGTDAALSVSVCEKQGSECVTLLRSVWSEACLRGVNQSSTPFSHCGWRTAVNRAHPYNHLYSFLHYCADNKIRRAFGRMFAVQYHQLVSGFLRYALMLRRHRLRRHKLRSISSIQKLRKTFDMSTFHSREKHQA